MITRTRYVYRAICAVFITAVCAGLFLLFWFGFITYKNPTGHLTGRTNILMSLSIYTLCLVVFMRALGGYRVGVNRVINIVSSQITAIFAVNLINVIISLAITGQIRLGFILLREYICLGILQAIFLPLLTYPLIRLYQKLFPPLKMLEIYGDKENNLNDKVSARADKYEIVKSVCIDENEERIKSEIARYDAVLINDLKSADKNKILKLCFDLNKRVYFTPKISDIIVKSSEDLNLFDTPLYLCRNIGMSGYQRAIKRFFDIILSAIALIITSPIFFITALLIKLEDGGEVFFKQERVTIGGRRFMIIKFRSMIPDAERDGSPLPAKNGDERITRIGSIIRPTRIDELPQLINILRGDMSIVGPRPERYEHVEKYTAEIPEFSFRLKVKGGLTGYAQVYGKYNTTALDKLKLDMEYIMNYSLLLDIQIILETVKILFQKESTEGFGK